MDMNHREFRLSIRGEKTCVSVVETDEGREEIDSVGREIKDEVRDGWGHGDNFRGFEGGAGFAVRVGAFGGEGDGIGFCGGEGEEVVGSVGDDFAAVATGGLDVW
jgi:hypothetical protein